MCFLWKIIKRKSFQRRTKFTWENKGYEIPRKVTLQAIIYRNFSFQVVYLCNELIESKAITSFKLMILFGINKTFFVLFFIYHSILLISFYIVLVFVLFFKSKANCFWSFIALDWHDLWKNNPESIAEPSFRSAARVIF